MRIILHPSSAGARNTAGVLGCQYCRGALNSAGLMGCQCCRHIGSPQLLACLRIPSCGGRLATPQLTDVQTILDTCGGKLSYSRSRNNGNVEARYEITEVSRYTVFWLKRFPNDEGSLNPFPTPPKNILVQTNPRVFCPRVGSPVIKRVSANPKIGRAFVLFLANDFR